MLHGGCCALWNVVLTRSSSHVPHTITAEYGNFCLITPENFLPLICSPVEVRRFFRCFSLRDGLFLGILPWNPASTDKSPANRSIGDFDVGILENAVNFTCCSPSVAQGQSDYPPVSLFTCALASASPFCSCHCVCPFKSFAQLTNAGWSCTTTNMVCNFSKAVPLRTQCDNNGDQSSLFAGGIINLCSINNISVRFIERTPFLLNLSTIYYNIVLILIKKCF